MATIHFLNVKQGDCSIIQHNSGRVSMIDVCNAKPSESLESISEMLSTTAMLMDGLSSKGISGNYNQKEYPVNPIAYLKEHGIEDIWRYVLTHPDMDHMDGIKALFEAYKPANFWDTDNKKEMENEVWSGSPYRYDDWEYYKNLRDTGPVSAPKRLTLLCGARGTYWNQDDDGRNGDGIYVLAPTQSLIEAANESGDYNDCSYVLLYKSGQRRIVFGGDSHDDTWDHILNVHRDAVTDIDILIAPHHGRDSKRSYEFLNVLKPKLTFFGNARSQYLAYSAWYNRELPIVTNNQANCMVVDISAGRMRFYVTNGVFARSWNPDTYYEQRLQAWFIRDL